jgi:hypothetical protein
MRVKVTSLSPMGNYRRAGRLWTVQPTVCDVSNAEYAEIAACPRLKVEIVPVEKPMMMKAQPEAPLAAAACEASQEYCEAPKKKRKAKQEG